MDASVQPVNINTDTFSEASNAEIDRPNIDNSLNVQALSTSFEQYDKQNDRFAKYHTGTLMNTITPQMVEICSGLRKINITNELKRLSSVVAQIQASFEVSGYPSRIVSVGMIAAELPNIQVIEDFSEEFLQKASEPVEIIDGMACIQNIPIWDRLPGERVDYFNAFKLYRDSRYFMLDDGTYMVSHRTIAGLARELSIVPAILTYISKIHCWADRCKAYDDYMETVIQRRKTQEIAMLQSDHAQLARTLCDKAMGYLKKNFDKLQPKEVLQALELGLKFGRISAGLLGDKPGSATGAQNSFSFVQNTTNNADKMVNIQTNSNPVATQLQKDIKQEDNLLSVLHILQASGAMTTAIHTDLVSNGETGLDCIESEEVE